MYKGKKFLVIIPARGGSKGLPGKNTRVLGDKPLIAWSVEAAKKSKYIDRCIISTDSDEIAGVAAQFGADVPFKRPAELATDSAKMVDVLHHAMNFIEEQEGVYDYLVLLQPTSPFRSETHVDESIELLMAKKGKVVLGVVEAEHSPLLCGNLPPDGNMGDFYDKRWQNLNRQDMKKFYRVNGAIYVVDWDFWKQKQSWIEKDTFAYVMDRKFSVDIDTVEDFLMAEAYLQHSLIGKS